MVFITPGMQKIDAFATDLRYTTKKHVRTYGSKWFELPNKFPQNDSNDHAWKDDKPELGIIKAYGDLAARLVDEFELLGMGHGQAEELAKLLISGTAGDDVVTHVGDHMQFKKAITSAHLKEILKGAKSFVQSTQEKQMKGAKDQFAKVRNAQNLGFGVTPVGPSSIALMQPVSAQFDAEADEYDAEELYLNDPNNIEGQTPNDSVTPGDGPNPTGDNDANKEGPAFTVDGQPVYLNEDSDDDVYLNDPNNIEGQTPNDGVTPWGGATSDTARQALEVGGRTKRGAIQQHGNSIEPAPSITELADIEADVSDDEEYSVRSSDLFEPYREASEPAAPGPNPPGDNDAKKEGRTVTIGGQSFDLYEDGDDD